MPTCPVCAGEWRPAFTATVLNRHSVQYVWCPACGMVQTEPPYWLDEAYRETIPAADTGLVTRNIELSAKLAGILYFCFDRKGSYVDIAGGYGMLVRLMRDHGFDFYWQDPYCENVLARGFEEHEAAGAIVALTAFEVLEHVHDPVAFVAEALRQRRTDTLIFSTQVYAGDQPPGQDWWYYSFSTGQHVSFYQIRTLRAIAGKLGLKFYSANGIHVFTSRTLNRSVFGLVSGGASCLVAPYVRRRLGPKTWDDHERAKGKSGASGTR